jgi:cytosine permease
MPEGESVPSTHQEFVDAAGDFATVPVPQSQRRTLLNIMFVYADVVAVVAAIFAGGALGLWLNFSDMVLAVFLGAIILAVIGGLTAYIGATTGCSTYVNTRYAFGRAGSWIVGITLITVTTGIGWFAFETWLFGVIINQLFPNNFFFSIGVASLWGGLLMTTTAIVGYRGLAYLSYLTVPGWILLSVIGFWAAVDAGGGFGRLFTATPADPQSLLKGITATVGTYIAGAIIASDIARFARRPRHGALGWTVQVLTLFPLLVIAGGVLMLLTASFDIATAMAAAGLGAGVFLMVVTGQWSTNDNNLYSGALAISNAVRWKKAYITLVLGVIGSLYAAYIGFTSQASFTPFQHFITLLGSILPAMAGVYIADFYVVQPYLHGRRDPKARYDFRPGTRIPEVNVAGILALVVGATVGVVATPQGSATEPMVSLPILPGAVWALIVSILAYVVIILVCRGLRISYTTGQHVQAPTGL